MCMYVQHSLRPHLSPGGGLIFSLPVQWQSPSHPCHPISLAGPLSLRAFYRWLPQLHTKMRNDTGVEVCMNAGTGEYWENELWGASSVKLGAMKCGQEGWDEMGCVLQEWVMYGSCSGLIMVRKRQRFTQDEEQIRSCWMRKHTAPAKTFLLLNSSQKSQFCWCFVVRLYEVLIQSQCVIIQ